MIQTATDRNYADISAHVLEFLGERTNASWEVVFNTVTGHGVVYYPDPPRTIFTIRQQRDGHVYGAILCRGEPARETMRRLLISVRLVLAHTYDEP